ncbi:hypothetical protein [Roseicyclus amphidinii]|uniref:hypothetical protein n=1 Tax=Roseicyclus amphidinii TaxID=3034232 RepID=UPI0024E1163C|nr:hypothetical protein [Roseicyclus sp. Amp-Y-6]
MGKLNQLVVLSGAEMASILKKLLKLASTPPKNRKRVFPKVTDYIPSETSIEGVWCTPADGELIIRKYYRDFRGDRKAEQAAVDAFFGILERTAQELEEIINEFRYDLINERQHAQDEISKAKNEEDRLELTRLYEYDIKQHEKRLSKVEKWVSRQLDLTKQDCRKPLRAVLTTVRTSENEGFYLTSDQVESERDYQYPELPESYY